MLYELFLVANVSFHLFDFPPCLRARWKAGLQQILPGLACIDGKEFELHYSGMMDNGVDSVLHRHEDLGAVALNSDGPAAHSSSFSS